MKKGIVLSVATLAIFGCNKKNMSSEITQTTSSTGITSNLKQTGTWGICCVWNGVDDCVKPAVNCFDPIIITPKASELRAAKSKLDSSITKGSKVISEFFMSDDAKKLFPDLTCVCDKNTFLEYYNKLVSGNYYIDLNQKGNKFYYQVKPNGSNLVDFVLVIKQEGLGKE